MSSISQSTVKRVTIIQGMLDIGGDEPIVPENVHKVVKAPDAFPMGNALANMQKAGLVTKHKSGKYRKNRPIMAYKLTDKAQQYHEERLDELQTYGHYEIIYTETYKAKSTQEKLPLEPEKPVYSAAVMAAMDELSQVASINEHALNCINDMQRALEAYHLKQNDTSFKVSGSLKMIQDDTKVMQKTIKEIGNLVNQHIGE